MKKLTSNMVASKTTCKSIEPLENVNFLLHVSDTLHVDELISCMHMMVPFYTVWNWIVLDVKLFVTHKYFLTLISYEQRGVQSSVVLDSVNCRILPHFDKVFFPYFMLKLLRFEHQTMFFNDRFFSLQIRSNFGQFKESLEEFSAYYASLSYS